jgi:hypothetical protein
LLVIAVWLWIAFRGGAEFLEGSFLTHFFGWFHRDTDAETIRLWAWIAITGRTIWFLVGLFTPAARFAS